ncbi:MULTISPECIES: CD3337/EF1877 family mobilome membrane protein [Bacillus]|uniref:CD3337/EF1877 family mobilome membrane protein n=1 Tax=Bacillus TaxID=1386 RepID=UPI001572B1F3|nr:MULTISPECIES: CPBP family intramembrane metalloprotease [Bacillus]MBC6975123.1 CPBP family intramembrane metalloprotease [Bacillus sp. Xin]MBY0600367.1 type IV secretion system protein [Bacillus bingmayongensis]NSW38452.1 CPBP family intramembrane metalloprotease [Bacillus sp. Xin1]
MKKFLSICMIFVFFLLPLGSQVTLAEEKNKTGTGRISNNLFQGYTDGIYKDKYYEIDTYQPKEEDKGILEKGWDYLFGDDSIGKDLQRMLYTVCQWFANMAFQLNVILGQLTIFLVDQALKLDIVDAVADKLAAAMQNIAGVGKKGFLESGLFPAIIGITCALSACYAGYVFFIKRQPTAGLNELVKTVLVIAFIIVYIGNASTILKSANTISSEISTTVLAKATGTVAGDPGRSKLDAIFSVKKQIWDLLVERPYLFLQYGEDSKKKIGEKRVDELLAKPPGKERNELVGKEIQNGNKMMVLSSVSDRLVFTLMYYIVNAFAGIPVIVFCLLIVAFQLWFMVMSIIAPIVMAVALLPGNRRVMESWAKQWVKPLALKIFASALLIIIFTVAELLYVLPEAGIAGYVSTMVLQILVFVLCYIFRDSLVASFKKVRGVYQVATDISLMTERFVDKGKELTGDTLSSVGDKIGGHFNSAAELAAAGGGVVEALDDQSEKDKEQQLIKANVPKNLSKEEMDKKKSNLISLQDQDKKEEPENEEEKDEIEEELDQSDEDAALRHNLIRLDKEALEEQLEEDQEQLEDEQETTPLEDHDMVPNQELVSLQEEGEMVGEPTTLEDDVQDIPHDELDTIEIVEHPTNELDTKELVTEEIPTNLSEHELATEEIPTDLLPQDIPTEEIPTDISAQDITTEEIPTNIPTQEIRTEEVPTDIIPGEIRADVTDDGVIVPRTEKTTSSLVSDTIPGEIPVKADETERILPQNTHIDVESTEQVLASDESSFSIPTQSVPISNLAQAKEKKDSEPVSEWDIELSDTPNLQWDSLAAGSENWNPPSQGFKNLDSLQSPEDE